MDREARGAIITVTVIVAAIALATAHVNKGIRSDITALDNRITDEQAARITAGADLERGIADVSKTLNQRCEEQDNAASALKDEIKALESRIAALEPPEEEEEAAVEETAAETNADGVDTSGWDFYGTYGCTAYYNPNGNHTASGTWPTAGRTVACNYLDFGTQIYIEGLGYRTIEDNGYIPDNVARFDVFFDTYAECMNWGVQTRRIWIVK